MVRIFSHSRKKDIRGRTIVAEFKKLPTAASDQVLCLSTFKVMISGARRTQHHAYDRIIHPATAELVEIKLGKPHKMEMSFTPAHPGPSHSYNSARTDIRKVSQTHKNQPAHTGTYTCTTTSSLTRTRKYARKQARPRPAGTPCPHTHA